MTEETIEKMISDWYLSTPRDINELSEQLLEQHEAEMVEFANLCLKHEIATGHDGIRRFACYAGDATYIVDAQELLTLFKNRKK